MNEKLQRREVFTALVDTLNVAVTYGVLDDAERVLAGLRILRPRMVELDTFEAWIAMKRGYWTDAIKVLHNVCNETATSSLATALMAFCQYATGNAEWKISASRVMDGESTKEAIGLVRLLLDPKAVEPAEESVEDESASASGLAMTSLRQPEGMYLRA